MKNLFSVLLMIILSLSVVACGKPTDKDVDKNNPDNIQNTNVLIAYFSCTDTTEGIAKHIQNKTRGTLFEIQAKIPYTADDLKYYTNCRADREQQDPNARPEIENKITGLSKYDVIFLGYPIWHGQAPKIIYTFLESYDFSNKIIIPFCTSGSSGIGNSATNLHSLTNAEWKEGRRFAKGTSYNTVSEWIDILDIKIKTKDEDMDFFLTIGEERLSVTLENNSATKELKEKLKTSPITFNMNDYGGWEKVGNLGFDLPTNDERITTQFGDIVLYQGNQLVIFYSSNTWSYTRLGRIIDITLEELKTILGIGDITITLSLESV